MNFNIKENINGTSQREKLLNESDQIRISNLNKKELNFKYVIIGDFGVGKTSIIQRYTEGAFSSSYKLTIGADFAIKTLEWNDDLRINLHLWDIAGHERFGSLTSIFYKHAVGAALVFDLTRPDTFNSVLKWLTDLQRKLYLPEGTTIPIILLANKGDITTQTLPVDIDVFCKKNNFIAWFITSAKNNIDIDEAMIRLTNVALKNYHHQQQLNVENDVIKLQHENDKKSLSSKTKNKKRKSYCWLL